MIKFNSDDSIPLNKLIYFSTITVIIRCVFKQNGVFYPQVYLDDCLYQTMISNERLTKVNLLILVKVKNLKNA